MATPKTVDSTPIAYATGSDLVLKRDWRTVADLITDDNVRPTLVTVVSHPVVLDALLTASGEIESACYYGGRYKRIDLQALNNAGKAMLVQLCCDLAFWLLKKRRSPAVNPAQVSGALEAFDKLDKLRRGERIFPFVETQEASLGDTAKAHTDSPPRISEVARRYFGGRSYRRYPY